MTRLIRNIGVLAHIDAGKTTLVERMLHLAGESDWMGDVEEGSTVTDWMAEEQRRGISITAAASRLRWSGVTIHLIDTPGHIDFGAEVEASLAALDGAVLVVSAVEGVQPQTELIWRSLVRRDLPVLVFFNKMDREVKDADELLLELEALVDRPVLAMQVPEGGLGVLDLAAGRWCPWAAGASAPDDDAVAFHQEWFTERLADLDDSVLEAALEGRPLSEGHLRSAARRAVVSARVVPALWGAAKLGFGVDRLLDAVVDLLPEPAERPPLVNALWEGPPVMARSESAPFIAQVFKVQRLPGTPRLAFVRVFSGKARAGERLLAARGAMVEGWQAWTVMGASVEPLTQLTMGDVAAISGFDGLAVGDTLHAEELIFALERPSSPPPVLQIAIEAEREADLPSLGAALEELVEDDPGLELRTSADGASWSLGGMGELHLDVALRRLGEGRTPPFRAGRPEAIVYMGITRSGRGEAALIREGADGAIVDVGVTVEVQPGPSGGGCILEGAERMPAALREGLQSIERGQGRLGLPLADLRWSISQVHARGDGLEAVLRACAAEAGQLAVEAAGPRRLIPWMSLALDVPLDSTGAVLSDLQARRAEIAGIHTEGRRQRVLAEVPMETLGSYASALRSLTQGRGEVLMRPAGHRPTTGDGP